MVLPDVPRVAASPPENLSAYRMADIEKHLEKILVAHALESFHPGDAAFQPTLQILIHRLEFCAASQYRLGDLTQVEGRENAMLVEIVAVSEEEE